MAPPMTPPYSDTLSAPPGECTLNMIDSWGDGWNGNQWEGAGYTFTLDSGSSGSETFILAVLAISALYAAALPDPRRSYSFARPHARRCW